MPTSTLERVDLGVRRRIGTEWPINCTSTTARKREAQRAPERTTEPKAKRPVDALETLPSSAAEEHLRDRGDQRIKLDFDGCKPT